MTFASLSGGRDSTAMVVKWLECKNSLDYILFCNTGFEFQEMLEYINKLDNYIQSRFNMSITTLDTSDVIEKWAFFKPISRGDRKGRFRGIARVLGVDYCTREAKIKPMKKFITKLSPNKYKNKILIGYTHNEIESGRVSNVDYGVSVYPLHEWGFNEVDVDNFLKKRGIHNRLYEKFERTGCFFCPKQSINSLYQLFKAYPKEWELMKSWEDRAKKLNCVNQTFKIGISLKELELKFKNNDDRSLFDFGFIEQDVCFCK